MKSIFPSVIDGDLLKLVHLSNGFKIVNGAIPLRAEDTCNAEARITSVINTNAGKVMKVKGYMYHAGVAVTQVVSSFLYRGRFTDYQNTFETTEKPSYMVYPERDADVGVIQSKDWFEWDDASKPLQVGTSLPFCIQSRVTFKDKTSYCDVSVSDNVFIRDQLKRLVKVGSVDFEQDNFRGNAVVTYLQPGCLALCERFPESSNTFPHVCHPPVTVGVCRCLLGDSLASCP